LKLDKASTASLRTRFRDVFGGVEGLRVALAPGRVNLIGEHTDYNDGWVLPMAIDRHVWVAFTRRSGRTLRAYSTVFEDLAEINLDELESARGTRWISYIAGIAWALAESGFAPSGIDMLVGGDLPIGSGLSSSAALEMATARALCETSGIRWRPKELALLAQKAENEYVGVSCGPMDQLASAAARAGCAMLLDCRTMETETVPMPDDARIVVMDTGVRRSLAASAYNDRRASCDEAVDIVRQLEPEVRALRDVDIALLETARGRMGDVCFRRARHVVEENARPAAMAEALRSACLGEAGRLMDESHASLRDLYEVSSEELDLITRLARRHPACFGARLTGAGFGGCAVALVAAQGADAFVDEVQAAYSVRVDLPGRFFACSPVDGARLLEPAVTIDERQSALLKG